MPTVPVKAAGWRIEPPVSVAVAPRQSRAATAAADPPEEPPGTRWAPWTVPEASEACTFEPRRHHRAEGAGLVRRAHGELVVVELAQHHRAFAPQLLRDGRLILRLEALEDVRAGRGLEAVRAEQVLDAERQPFEGAGLSLGEARLGGLRHLERTLRRLEHEGVERPRLLDRADMGARELGRGEALRLEPVAGVGKSEGREIGHLVFVPSRHGRA